MTKPIRSWWHELNTWDPQSARDFYKRTLGWDFEPAILPDGSDYWIARKNGSPMGGMFALHQPDYTGIPSHWMTYMAVADIADAQNAARKSGGEITRPAMHVPGVGKLAVITDAAGALIGLIEPDPAHVLHGTSRNMAEAHLA